MSAPHLYPVVNHGVGRAEREARMKQRALAVWLFGLSGAGKSTLALGLERKLVEDGYVTTLLDGDNLRQGLNSDLGFSNGDRSENIRRAAEVARLFIDAGIIVICSFITPLRTQRALAVNSIGRDDVLMVFVRASVEECARRDPKGLYARATAGSLRNFTGRDSAFEPPDLSDRTMTVDTERSTPDACLDRLYRSILPRLRWQQ